MKCDDKSLELLLEADDGSSDHPQIAKHVEACNRCQARLVQLAADADDWSEAKHWLAMDSVSDRSLGRASEEASKDLSHDADARHWRKGHRAGAGVWTESMAKSLLAPPSHPEMLGRIGRYDVERLIGSGGMGVVFKAYDTELNRPVAVKLLAPYLAENGSARKRFAREARAAAAVVDDHVVPIHNVETGDEPGREPPFLVMKYIAGGSLQQRLDRDGPLDVCEILRIGMQTAKGLAAAHAQGLIHRDFKPSNILLDEGVERALLTDFGLARAEDDACLTRSGFHPGTPHYMSPEQVRGEAIDGRSDLFGLGCVLYALCNGHPPFRAETSYAVLRRITDDTARPIRELNSEIPEWLEAIVMKLLSKSRDDRFDSAEQVAELLEDCLAHRQHPTTTPLPERAAVPSSAHGDRPPWGKLIAAAAFAFSMLLAGFLIVLELDKGTLTIESEMDDVPIRIMQGEDVVRELTVTQTGTSVRVASGEYVVLVDGDFNEIRVQSGTVSLSRGETRTVRIVQSERVAARTATAGNELNAAELAGVLTAEQVVAHGNQLSKYKNEPITVRFRVGSVEQRELNNSFGYPWHLSSSVEPHALGVGALNVWISPAAEAALKKQGVTNFKEHFFGKTVTIKGQVEAGQVIAYGRRSLWAYSIALDAIDQLIGTETAAETVSDTLDRSNDLGHSGWQRQQNVAVRKYQEPTADFSFHFSFSS